MPHSSSSRKQPDVINRKLKSVESDAEKTLLYRIGGDDALECTIIRFYELVSEDERLDPFFGDGTINMASLRAHQQRFMTLAFTKIPDDFDVMAFMIERHSRLFENGLTEEHFDRVAGHLVTALREMWISQEIINEVVSLLQPFRKAFDKKEREQNQQQRLLLLRAAEKEESKLDDDDDVKTTTSTKEGRHTTKKSKQKIFKSLLKRILCSDAKKYHDKTLK